MSKTNLWKETIEDLTSNGKTWDDVIFISNMIGEKYSTNKQTFEIEKADFEKIARVLDYDSGFGGEEINRSLIIAGDGWWMERHEYDGSEWWEFKSHPERPPGGSIVTEAKIHLLGIEVENIDTLCIRVGG